jgi:hypothetical protein
MKKIPCLLLSMLFVFGLVACNRSRQQNNIDITVPAPTNPPATVAPTLVPTSTLAPAQPAPSATPAVTQVDPSAAATAEADLEKTLNDLEQLLGNTNTNINVP